MITIRFKNFWAGSETIQTNFFLPLLESVYEKEVFITNDLTQIVDLEISSVFKEKHTVSQRIFRKGLSSLKGILPRDQVEISPLEPRNAMNAKRRIWYTGENLRPPLADDFDAYLSFDSDEYHPSNVYLPLWVLNIDWFSKSQMHGFTSVYPSQESLLEPRPISFTDIQNRSGVCSFIGVMEETRRSALRNISHSLDTQIFGKSVGRQVPDKIHAAKPFRFILAFENSIYPGYVTEKLLEASLTGAFPLFWGPSKIDYFNPARFINLSDFDNLETFNSEILRLNEAQDELVDRLSQPIMLKRFDLDKLTLHLKRLLL
jgi:hypothetical protein